MAISPDLIELWRSAKARCTERIAGLNSSELSELVWLRIEPEIVNMYHNLVHWSGPTPNGKLGSPDRDPGHQIGRPEYLARRYEGAHAETVAAVEACVAWLDRLPADRDWVREEFIAWRHATRETRMWSEWAETEAAAHAQA